MSEDAPSPSFERLPANVEPETPEQALMMLDRARAALDAALDYQQVRHCRTLAVAAAAYAREAKDSTLVEKATRLRVQAERRAGQMLIASAERGERASVGDGVAFGANRAHSSRETTSVPRLADIGISKHQSAEWQALARLSEDEFGGAVDAVAASDGRVTTAQVIATALASRPAASARSREAEGEEVSEGKSKRRKSAAEAAREHRLATLAESEAASRVFTLANGLRRELDASDAPLSDRDRQAMVALGHAYQRRIEASSTEEKG